MSIHDPELYEGVANCDVEPLLMRKVHNFIIPCQVADI